VKHPELPERVTRALGRARSARTDPEAAEELEREIVVHATLRRRHREQLDVDRRLSRSCAISCPAESPEKGVGVNRPDGT
jgi:hypothetical protein